MPSEFSTANIKAKLRADAPVVVGVIVAPPTVPHLTPPLTKIAVVRLGL